MNLPPRSDGTGARAPEATPQLKASPEALRPEHLEVPWTGLSILVIVLSLILFMAIPRGQAQDQERRSRAAELIARQAERQLNLAIREYRHDHGDWPGLAPAKDRKLSSRPTTSAAWIKRQLCLASNDRGEVSPLSSAEFPLGPYLLGEIPINPRTGLRSLRVLEPSTDPAGDDEPCGWVYDPRSGEVRGWRASE